MNEEKPRITTLQHEEEHWESGRCDRSSKKLGERERLCSAALIPAWGRREPKPQPQGRQAHNRMAVPAVGETYSYHIPRIQCKFYLL
jgi:hypothetical protein